jgi:hypothetical protein
MNEADETFAEVLNGFAGNRRKRTEPDPVAVAPAEPGRSTVDGLVDVDLLPLDGAEAASIVRPYSWTRGRTKSTVDLRIEAMVTTTERGDDLDALTHSEHRAVAELCLQPRSVAEVATLLGVPLGVAKVLLGDMANLGLVVVHKTATGGANKAHLLLMERVLSGLRRL